MTGVSDISVTYDDEETFNDSSDDSLEEIALNTQEIQNNFLADLVHKIRTANEISDYSPASVDDPVSPFNGCEDNLNHFFQRKMNILKQSSDENTKPTNHKRVNKYQRNVVSYSGFQSNHLKLSTINETQEAEKEFYNEWANKLLFTRFQECIRQMKTESIHNAELCKFCLQRKSEVESSQILKKWVNQATESLMDMRIDEHLINHNAITLIGQIAADLPRIKNQNL